jgi:hypothetical protein
MRASSIEGCDLKEHAEVRDISSRFLNKSESRENCAARCQDVIDEKNPL